MAYKNWVVDQIFSRIKKLLLSFFLSELTFSTRGIHFLVLRRKAGLSLLRRALHIHGHWQLQMSLDSSIFLYFKEKKTTP